MGYVQQKARILTFYTQRFMFPKLLNNNSMYLSNLHFKDQAKRISMAIKTKMKAMTIFFYEEGNSSLFRIA